MTLPALLPPGADVLHKDDLDIDGKKVVLYDPTTQQMTAGGAPVSGGGISGLDNEKLSQLFGDDQMLIGTFANRPLATTVAVGKEYMATDFGRARWVSDGTNWLALTPCTLYNTGQPQSFTDTAGQATAESNLLSLAWPLNLFDGNDGFEVEGQFSCTNSAATKRVRGRFGGSVLFNLDLTTHQVFPFKFRVRNRGTRSSQVATPNSLTMYGAIGSVGVQTFNVDFGTAQTFTLTGQFPVTGTGTNSVGLEDVVVRMV